MQDEREAELPVLDRVREGVVAGAAGAVPAHVLACDDEGAGRLLPAVGEGGLPGRVRLCVTVWRVPAGLWASNACRMSGKRNCQSLTAFAKGSSPAPQAPSPLTSWQATMKSRPAFCPLLVKVASPFASVCF